MYGKYNYIFGVKCLLLLTIILDQFYWWVNKHVKYTAVHVIELINFEGSIT